MHPKQKIIAGLVTDTAQTGLMTSLSRSPSICMPTCRTRLLHASPRPVNSRRSSYIQRRLASILTMHTQPTPAPTLTTTVNTPANTDADNSSDDEHPANVDADNTCFPFTSPFHYGQVYICTEFNHAYPGESAGTPCNFHLPGYSARLEIKHQMRGLSRVHVISLMCVFFCAHTLVL